MTTKNPSIKEAILKGMDEIQTLTNSREVGDYIIKHRLYDFGFAKTPFATISAILGDFIRNNDTRVKRIKEGNGKYLYYLSKYEQNINFDKLEKNDQNIHNYKPSKTKCKKTFRERDLHKLLSSYLKHDGFYSKTIFHEQSKGKDDNQIWTHPDMIAIKFLRLKNKASHTFLKSINRIDTFKLCSYELKKEINNDSELKKAYFQAVSNSSWANYGYLVAFEFSDNLYEEMARLNQSFGIGIIELSTMPFESKILFPAVLRDLDFKTIDKLCRINEQFEKFIEYNEKLMSASERYSSGAEKELEEFCDEYFKDNEDKEIEEYCKERNIPQNQDSE